MNPALFDWLGLLTSVWLARWRSGDSTRLKRNPVAVTNRPALISHECENPAESKSAGLEAINIPESRRHD